MNGKSLLHRSVHNRYTLGWLGPRGLPRHAKVCTIAYALDMLWTSRIATKAIWTGVSDIKVAFPTRTPWSAIIPTFRSEQCLTTLQVHLLAQICKARLV